MYAKLKALILSQLKQGVSPEGLAKTCAFAWLGGTFPVIGATTVLCGIFGVIFKLNQPLLQLGNYLLTPVQYILIPIYIRLGEKMMGAEPIEFDIKKMLEEFADNWQSFFAKYAVTAGYAILAWAVISTLIAYFIFLLCKPLFVKHL